MTFIQGTPLPPTAAQAGGKQFVVVVANADGGVNEDPSSLGTTYFRKYLLGGIVHGLSLLPANDPDTITGMTDMRDDLLLKCGFDNVITHNWLAASRDPIPNQTIYAGNKYV